MAGSDSGTVMWATGVPGSLVGDLKGTPMDRAPVRTRSPLVRMLSPLRDFLATEASGAILLATGAIGALVWANSPWSASYEVLWSSRAAVTIAGHTLDLDLRHWINDGLMTVFFFVVGLEIKREGRVTESGYVRLGTSNLCPFAGVPSGV